MRSNRIGNVFTLSALFALVAACGDGAEGGVVTFHKDIEPLLQKHCLGCHSPGNIAPFSLIRYQDARVFAAAMAESTRAERMPPWGARNTGECAPPATWKDDLRLWPDEIAKFEQWSAAGAPEGDIADAPPPYEPKSSTLPDRDVQLQPAKEWVTSGELDQFRCFPIDPGLNELRYVNGVHVIPGNPQVVHHAVLFTDPHGESTGLAGSDGSYECFGGAGVSDAATLAVWAPGGQPIELPANIGTPVSAGSKLILQIHYHPTGISAESDRTSIQLRYARSRPLYVLLTASIGNFFVEGENGDGLARGANDRGEFAEFRIPAKTRGHIERMQQTMPATVDGQPAPAMWLYGLMAHMHLAGVDERVTLARDADEVCLLQEPRWSFDWQRFYAYDATPEGLIQLRPGDRLKIRCTYDNDGTGDIFLGAGSRDEMCLAVVQLLQLNLN